MLDIPTEVVIVRDMNSTAVFTIAAKPKHADMMEFDCHFCEYHALTKPVFVTDGSNVYAAGAGCAAKIMFGDNRSAYVVQVRNASDLINYEVALAESARIERMERASKALSDFEAGIGYSPELQSMRVAFHKVSNGATFPEFMANVVKTGEFA